MGAARKYQGREKVMVRGDSSPPDPDEVAALDKAEEAVKGGRNAREAAELCITAWIQERAQRQAGARLADNLVFDLGDAQLRGHVAASLSQLGDALTTGPLTHIDTSAPLLSMDGPQLIDFLVCAIQGAREAAVAANEAIDFPFSDAATKGHGVTLNDDVPFGDAPISDSEVPF